MLIANGLAGTIGRHLPREVVPLHGDLATREQLSNFTAMKLEEATFIHLAGVVGGALVERDLTYSDRVNVRAVGEMAQAALDGGVKKFVFVSSSHVYKVSDCPLSEDSDLGPITTYANQKLRAEELLINVFSSAPERLCIVRLFSVLDWGMPSFTLGGAIERLIRNPSLEKLESSNSVRDFLTPSDAAQHLFAISKCTKSHGIINLCTGIGTTIENAARRMAGSKEILLRESNFLPSKGEPSRILGTNRKLLESIPTLDLKWNPKTN